MKIQELFESASVPQKIKPFKMPTPPKAPDATTSVGRTTDDGVSYQKDKTNPKLIVVSNGAGHYAFDGQRLVKWTSPMPQYKQIHDFVQRTITIDADTTVKGTQGEVTVNQKAVYDLQGNLKQGTGSIGVSAGGLAVRVNDKDGFNLSYYITDVVQLRVKQNNRKMQNANPNSVKKAMAMMQSKDLNSVMRGFNLLNTVGDVKWLVNGKATHPNELLTMIKTGKV